MDETGILEKESVVALGQRVYDMAEYISDQLSPGVNDEYATLVHGDYKAMVSENLSSAFFAWPFLETNAYSLYLERKAVTLHEVGHNLNFVSFTRCFAALNRLPGLDQFLIIITRHTQVVPMAENIQIIRVW